jgi:hypothetical protein
VACMLFQKDKYLLRLLVVLPTVVDWRSVAVCHLICLFSSGRSCLSPGLRGL